MSAEEVEVYAAPTGYDCNELKVNMNATIFW